MYENIYSWYLLKYIFEGFEFGRSAFHFYMNFYEIACGIHSYPYVELNSALAHF